MKINVNAVYKNIEKEILSYEDVVVLAGKNPNMVLSVSYSHRQSEKQGMLCKGDSVKKFFLHLKM